MFPAITIVNKDTVSDHQKRNQIQGIRRGLTKIGILNIHAKHIMSKDIAQDSDPADREQDEERFIERCQPLLLLVQVIIHIKELQRGEQWISKEEP